MLTSLFDGIMETFSDGSDKKKCNCCDNIFWFYTNKYECVECKNIFCINCKLEPSYLYKKVVCTNCDKINRDEMSKIIIVKSQYIGGHKILKHFSSIKSDFSSSNYDAPINNLKYLASKLGANGIVSFEQEKGTVSHTKSSGRGNYYSSLFESRGVAVLVEKNINNK